MRRWHHHDQAAIRKPQHLAVVDARADLQHWRAVVGVLDLQGAVVGALDVRHSRRLCGHASATRRNYLALQLLIRRVHKQIRMLLCFRGHGSVGNGAAAMLMVDQRLRQLPMGAAWLNCHAACMRAVQG
eukprot:366106-Chlamydomonas_euryale.AAC.5